MSEEESARDLVLIGLGGSGIKAMLALRALIEKEKLSAHGSRGNSCRLLAIDSNYLAQDYFRSLDDRDHENLLLAQNEYLGLLRNGENPWDKVTTDAKSNIPEAVKLYSQRRAIEINRSPDRSDYEAMIYVSRERMKQGVRDFLKNSEKSNKQSAKPITLMIATSLFGDTGSLSYLALLEILTELSEEIRCESINAFLFAPEGFRGFFHLNDSHTAKYLSVIHSLSGFRFNEGSEKIVPTQYLVSLDEESHVGPFPSVFEIFTETAKKLHGLIVEEFASDNRVQDDRGDSIIEVERLNLEKCLEIKNSFVDRLAADRRFNDLLRGYST